MRDKLYKILLKFKQSTSGATLVYFALIMPVFAGFAGLGFDATLWFMEKRQLQSVVDSSAVTAAYALSKNKNDHEILLAAVEDAGKNGFQTGGSNTVVVASPPTTGAYAGQANYVMVTVSRPGQQMFTRILGMENITIETRATAAILASGDHCILALDDTRDRALEFSGSADVHINCGVASNSNSSESIYVSGSANLSADPSAQSYGDIFIGPYATLDTPSPIQPFSQRASDPYGPAGRDLQVPLNPMACTDTSLSLNKSTPNISPGRYCNGLRISSGANVTFAPGVYIIDGGTFGVNGNATISGDGVTIILTGSPASNIATVTINGGANFNLTAPNFGTWAGIVFFQDPDAVYAGGPNKFLGGANMNLKGAVYFPSQELRYSGGSTGVSGCLQVIGNKVTFTGNSELVNNQDDCDGLGIEKVSRTIVTLEE